MDSLTLQQYSKYNSQLEDCKLIAGKTIRILVILACTLFISVYSLDQSVEAQLVKAQFIKSNFLIYNNPDFGIKIKYPSDWAKEEDSELKDVTFLVPSSPIKYAEKLSVSVLDNESGQSLVGIVNNLIDFNRHNNPSLTNYDVIESKPIVVNGNNAFKLVTTHSDSKFGNVKSMQVEILNGDKLDETLYTAEPQKYDTQLSTIQSMIDSFQITK